MLYLFAVGHLLAHLHNGIEERCASVVDQAIGIGDVFEHVIGNLCARAEYVVIVHLNAVTDVDTNKIIFFIIILYPTFVQLIDKLNC